MQTKGKVWLVIGIACICTSILLFTRSFKRVEPVVAHRPQPPVFNGAPPQTSASPAVLDWQGPYVSRDNQAATPITETKVDGLRFTTSGTATNDSGVNIVEVEEDRKAGKPPGNTKSVYTWWNPVTNAVGYRVYYGQATHNYTSLQEMGNATNGVIGGLKGNTVYYFAVTCYLNSGLESGFSTEVPFKTSK